MLKRKTMLPRQVTLDWTEAKFDSRPFFASPVSPFHVTPYGALLDDDCMNILPLVKDEVVDTVFADPPFNLGKQYGKRSNDSLSDEDYVCWCRKWLTECVRVLKPGGVGSDMDHAGRFRGLPDVRMLNELD